MEETEESKESLSIYELSGESILRAVKDHLFRWPIKPCGNSVRDHEILNLLSKFLLKLHLELLTTWISYIPENETHLNGIHNIPPE